MALQIRWHGCVADGAHERAVRREPAPVKKRYAEERLKAEIVARNYLLIIFSSARAKNAARRR
jgi:hypothetical protein